MGRKDLCEKLKAINEQYDIMVHEFQIGYEEFTNLTEEFKPFVEASRSLVKKKEEENILLNLQFEELKAKNEDLKNELIFVKSKFQEEQAKKNNEIQMLRQAIQDKEEDIERAQEKLNKMTTTITMAEGPAT